MSSPTASLTVDPQVIQQGSEGMNEKRSLLPCATCPWRIGKGAETIPAYSQQKALALRNTVGDSDGFRTIMACHHSSEDAPISCRGYLAQVGWTNINVRLFMAKGKIPGLHKIQGACRKINLHRNYGEMMDKLTMSYERMWARNSFGTTRAEARVTKEAQ